MNDTANRAEVDNGSIARTLAPALPGQGVPTMDFDPLVYIFPEMDADQFAGLVENIRQVGLREAIWTYKGKIIDGRHRYRACLEAGVEPKFREWDGVGDLTTFVVSANLHRRHLTTKERIEIAAKLVTSSHGGDRRSDQAAKLPIVSQAQAAAMMKVSVRSVGTACRDAEKNVREQIEDIEAELMKGSESEVHPPAEQKVLLAEHKQVRAKAGRSKATTHSDPTQANAVLPPPKQVSELDQYLILASKMARNCKFADVAKAIKVARQLFNKHQKTGHESNLDSRGV